MGQGLWGDDNSGHTVMWRLSAEYCGDQCSVCTGLQPPPSLPKPTPAALLSPFSKCPLRAAEDKQGGKERVKRHATGRQSTGISRETPLRILQS